jgi:hypothetical protein
MLHVKLALPMRLGALAILFLFLLQPDHEAAGTRSGGLWLPAYVTRGNQVAQHYRAYGKRLAEYHASLAAALKENAPDLLVYLKPQPPVMRGYHVLPPIIGDMPMERSVRMSAAYSWPWTDHLIDRERQKIASAEADLATARANLLTSRTILERLALAYPKLGAQHTTIDAHLQYNRLWQAAIASNRSGFDRETSLYYEVLERQRIVERLRRMRAAFEKSAITYNAAHRFAEMSGTLPSRVEWLTRRIAAELNEADMPDFVQIERAIDGWIIRVPLFTDITDHRFVREVKQSVEDAWQATEGGATYRVELDVRFVSENVLYPHGAKSPADKTLDLRAHLQRFPAGGAILTSGASTTHVRGRAIVLGPHALTPHVLAHEFGHVLGFRDRYIRGYKDLGKDGFLVMEVVADPHDIMSATAAGGVSPSHFAKILSRRLINLRPRLMPASKPAETASRT